MTIKFEGKTLTLAGNAHYAYNSSTPNPDEWVSDMATDAAGKEYKVWWEADLDRDLEDACKWSNPNYIEEV